MNVVAVVVIVATISNVITIIIAGVVTFVHNMQSPHCGCCWSWLLFLLCFSIIICKQCYCPHCCCHWYVALLFVVTIPIICIVSHCCLLLILQSFTVVICKQCNGCNCFCCCLWPYFLLLLLPSFAIVICKQWIAHCSSCFYLVALLFAITDCKSLPLPFANNAIAIFVVDVTLWHCCCCNVTIIYHCCLQTMSIHQNWRNPVLCTLK